MGQQNEDLENQTDDSCWIDFSDSHTQYFLIFFTITKMIAKAITLKIISIGPHSHASNQPSKMNGNG